MNTRLFNAGRKRRLLNSSGCTCQSKGCAIANCIDRIRQGFKECHRLHLCQHAFLPPPFLRQNRCTLPSDFLQVARQQHPLRHKKIHISLGNKNFRHTAALVLSQRLLEIDQRACNPHGRESCPSRTSTTGNAKKGGTVANWRRTRAPARSSGTLPSSKIITDRSSMQHGRHHWLGYRFSSKDNQHLRWQLGMQQIQAS